MAARVHADSSVNERRVRPIYDHLDNGNYKKALQEAEKLLKKQKDLPCAKALKALAMIRLKKVDEALEILSAIHATHPVDETTLQAMNICYRDIDKLDLLVDLMENAVKREPLNEDLLSQLFMCYIRAGDYRKQRLTAMQLHKIKQNNPYYFSAVMSIYMEASITKDEKQKATLLLLAERMVDKFVKEERIEAEAEVLITLMIFEAQCKYQEAIELLDGPLGENFSAVLHFVETKKAELLKALGRKDEAMAIYKQLYQNDCDNWQYFESYYSLVQECKCTNADIWSECLSFILSVHEKNLEGTVKRGPFLAALIVHFENSKAGGDAGSLKTFLDMLLAFFVRFGHKPVAYTDLRFIFNRLQVSPDTIQEFINSVENSVKGGANEFAPIDNISDLYRHLCFLRLRHYLIEEKSDKKMALVSLLRTFYGHTVTLAKDLLPTDQNPADGYIQLATHVALEVAHETGKESILVDIVHWLEQALSKSPSAFALKLLLLKVYSILGIGRLVMWTAERLEIKYIMYDTFGYMVNGALLRSGHYVRAGLMLSAALKLYSSVKKETGDALGSSYKYGTFNKIPEVIAFRERLLNSLQFALNTADEMMLSLQMDPGKSLDGYSKLFKDFSIDPENDETSWDELEDNRDFEIILPSRLEVVKQVEESKRSSFADEVRFLKIRNLTIRCLACVYQMEEDATKVDVLEKLTNRLEVLVEPRDIPEERWFPIEGAFTSRLCVFLRGNFGIPLVAMFKLLAQVAHAYHNQSLATLHVELASIAKEISGLTNRIKNLNRTSFVDMRRHVEELVNFCELMTICTAALNVLVQFVKSVLKSKKSKKKNKDSVVNEPEVAIVGEVTSLRKSIVESVEAMSTPLVDRNDMEDLVKNLAAKCNVKNDSSPSIPNGTTTTTTPIGDTAATESCTDRISREILLSYEESYSMFLSVLEDRRTQLNAMAL